MVMLYMVALLDPIGGQKIGTTFGSFLKSNVGARAEALFSGIAITDDATATYMNSSILAFLDGRGVAFSHRLLPAQINHSFLSYYFRKGYWGLGFFVNSLWTPYEEVTTEYNPYGNGYFWNFSDIVLGLSAATSLYDRFAIGGSLKFLQENLYDTSYYAFMLDFSSIYLVGYRDIRIGMGIYNIGPDVSGWALPVTFRLGISGRLYRSLYGAAQLEKQSDNYEIFSLGLEYRMEVLHLRAGITSRGEKAFGLGLITKKMRLDYTYTDRGLFGATNTFTIGVNWK